MGFTTTHQDESPLSSGSQNGAEKKFYSADRQSLTILVPGKMEEKTKQWLSDLEHMEEEIRLLHRYFLMADFSKTPSLKISFKSRLDTLLQTKVLKTQLRARALVQNMNTSASGHLSRDAFDSFQELRLEVRQLKDQFSKMRVEVLKTIVDHYPVRIL